jgi:uncharacterized protein (TIGR02594 family)
MTVLVRSEDLRVRGRSARTVPPEYARYPWMWYAIEEEGTREDLSRRGDNPQVMKYYEACYNSSAKGVRFEHDSVPWCSAFANWCLEQAGYRGTGSSWARDFLKWENAIPLHTPVWGCVTVLRRGAGSGHVGFFWKRKAGQIMLLGGNLADSRSGGDGASVNKRLFSPERVLGYLWPTQGRTLPPVFKVRHDTEIA